MKKITKNGTQCTSDTITDAQIVFQVASDTPDGVNNTEVQSIMTEVFTKIEAGVEGLEITSPYENPQQVSATQPIAYAIMKLPDGDSQAEQQKIGDEIRAITEPILVERNALNVVDVEFGGDPFVEFELPESEVVGLLAAIIILVLAFGSVLAMGLPIGTALIGLGTGISIVTMLSHVMEMPDFVVQIGGMIGIALGLAIAAAGSALMDVPISATYKPRLAPRYQFSRRMNDQVYASLYTLRSRAALTRILIG